MATTRRESDGPAIHLDAEEDDSVMTTSDYAQVVFQDVQECYQPGHSITITYMLTQAIKPSSRDWVGIFKVGWSSTRQYLAFDWAPIPPNWETGKICTQRIMLDAYYLPREEDGEFYQFCYIDSYGKMRGASTPFQFLRRPADDFVEVVDDSMDMLMIQSRQQATLEQQLQKTMKQLDELTGERTSLESETLELRETVEKQQKAMRDLKTQYDELLKAKEEADTKNKGLQHEKKTLEGRLEEVHSALVSLEHDKTQCEDTLQQTINKLHEAEKQIDRVNVEKEQLFKDIEHVCMEREEFKSQFANSEKLNEEMRREVTSLMQQLSNHSEQTKVVKENETKVREEKRKIEQQLLVASADREHLRTIKEKLKQRESQLAAAEQNRKYLSDEIDTMKTVNQKLSQDLEVAYTEKDAMKGQLARKEKEFHERDRKFQGNMHLMQHQAKEKENLLNDQVKTLKDSIKQLVEEKEVALRGHKGPMQASQVAMKDLRTKLKKAQDKCEDETKKRIEMHKTLTAVEATYVSEREDFQKEIEDMKIRLSMGAEEYKKKYLECKTLEAKYDKLKKTQTKRDSTTSVTKEEVALEKAAASPGTSSDDKGTQSGLPAAAVLNAPTTPADGGTFDSKELAEQLKELMQELEDRSGKVKRYKLKYMEEKEKNSSLVQERDALRDKLKEQEDRMKNMEEEMTAKIQSQKEENDQLQQNFNKLHSDYMQMKHSFESVKFDMAQASQESTPTKQQRPPIVEPPASPERDLPLQFKNPYTQSQSQTQSPVDVVPEQKFPNPYVEEGAAQPTAPPMSVPPEGSSLLSPVYPPDIGLPEPLQPHILPQAKIAAIKNATRSTNSNGEPICDMSDDRDEVADEFHDARELPEDGSIKKCPECSIDFPPSFPEEDFVMHIQQHFARQCPMCQLLMSGETEEDHQAFANHVETHFTYEDDDQEVA
ncbi:uncharacterized protein [Amphiura filiformis]|uniref:uncharacterized protein n=1 Tax=Amphiura filiformis TaxID=82378 RepID=UPI003B215F45